MTEPSENSRTGFAHLYPYRSNYLKINNLDYHYVDQGQGPPALMVHGNPSWSFYFRALIDGLSPNMRTIVPDHIGCGFSEKPTEGVYDFILERRVDDLEALVEHLDLKEKLTLIMHDWGGAIGTALALRKPDRIGRIVVLNTSAFLMPSSKKVPFLLTLARKPGLLASFLVQGLNLFSLGATYLAVKKKMPKDVRKGLIAPYNSWHNRLAVLKFVQDIPIDETDPSYGLLKQMDENLESLAHIPMLILWGMKDFVFDANYYNQWRSRFPAAEAHEFSQAGHYILEDEPEAVLSKIVSFLERYSN